MEDVLVLFKGFVKQYRPSIDIDNVATGETWFGEDALKKGLCDEIKTKDDVLLDYVDKGYDVFEVRYEPPLTSSLIGLAPATTTNSNSWVRSSIRWLFNIVREELDGDLGLNNKYLMKDDSNDRIRIQD